MTTVVSICLAFCIMLPAWAVAYPREIQIPLSDYTSTNIPNAAKYLLGASLAFDTPEPSPPGAAYYFLRYRFTIPPTGNNALYNLVLQGGQGPGSRGQSGYSWVVDAGEVHPALRLQCVLPEGNNDIEHVQPSIRLTSGEHTIELRFYPEQRLRIMNRATEAFYGHYVNLQGLAWRPSLALAPSKRSPLAPSCRLRQHDTIVLFGDSITEEEFYARHLVRILNRAFPGNSITVYNAGISLNRSIDAVARLDHDVLALSPDWAVLAFGVNDAMQLSPEEYAGYCDTMVRRLQAHKTQVLCAAPTGMLPHAELLGDAFFSMHASDRASAIDHTMKVNTALLYKVAREHKALFADIYAAFTRTVIPRFSLMNNQWHPNDEGGRMYAVTLLRTWGVTEAEMARTGDQRDLAYYRALAALPRREVAPPPIVKPLLAPLQGTVIFGAAFGDNRLLVYASDGRQLAVLPTAHHPAALAYARRRKELYLACEGSGCLQVLALPDLHPVTEIKLGLEAYPTSLALSTDENTLWIASYFGSKIIEFDVATRSPLRDIPLPDVVNGVALAPDGHTLLVSLPGKLAFVDTTKGKIITTINTIKFTTSCISLPDGKLILLDAARWQMYPVDVTTGKLGAPVPAPAQTRALALDPATGHLFAADWLNSRLLEFDGARCLRTTPLPAPALALAVVHVE